MKNLMKPFLFLAALLASFNPTLFVKNLVQNRSGQGMVEYGLILALVTVVVIGIITLIGGELKTVFNDILTELQGGTTS